MSERVEEENVCADSSDAAVDPAMHIRDAIGDPFSKLRTRLFSPLPPASPGGVRALRAPKMSEHTAMGFGLLGAQQARGARLGTAGAAGGLDCHSVDSSLVLAPGVTLGSDRGDDCNNDVSSIATDETGEANITLTSMRVCLSVCACVSVCLCVRVASLWINVWHDW